MRRGYSSLLQLLGTVGLLGTAALRALVRDPLGIALPERTRTRARESNNRASAPEQSRRTCKEFGRGEEERAARTRSTKVDPGSAVTGKAQPEPAAGPSGNNRQRPDVTSLFRSGQQQAGEEGSSPMTAIGMPAFRVY